jgi:DNA repair protein RecN (Recombination protein N)
MLSELKVSNFAIIDNVQIQFQAGLNIMSGETGAGKSIILKSLALLMGQKASSEAVKSGCESAIIEGLFDLSGREDLLDRLKDLGMLDEERLIVRRIVSSQGKNKIYINGALSTLQTLQDLIFPIIQVTGDVAPLIELTGQHENRSLLSKDYHLDCVDMFGGHGVQRRELTAIYQSWKAAHSELEGLVNSDRERVQRLDYLRFQRDEIKGAGVDPSIDIEAEYLRNKNSARLVEFAAQAESTLFQPEDSINARLQRLGQRAQEMRALDPNLEPLILRMNDLRANVEDLAYEFGQYGGRLECDPERLAEIEDQLARLRSLQRKYGSDLSAISETLVQFEDEIAGLENADTRIEELKALTAKLESEFLSKATKLHGLREEKAKELARIVNHHLRDLNMKDTKFAIALSKRGTGNEAWRETGITEVEFTIQASSQDLARPLGKVASGGELSRILLSLKEAIGHQELPRTYLFDEVDTGVSGPTAEKVGRKLREISKGQQVICVTHLPQVAAFGSTHFLIQKTIKKSGAQTEVIALDKKARVQELARLISGEKITKTSLAHAESLLEM